MESIENTIPVKTCRHEENEGVVTLYYKDPKPPLILRVFFKKLAAKEMKFDLDDIGKFIWKLIDGENEVKDIVAKARIEFGQKVEPAETRVGLFIKQLHKGRFISLYKKKLT